MPASLTQSTRLDRQDRKMASVLKHATAKPAQADKGTDNACSRWMNRLALDESLLLQGGLTKERTVLKFA